MIIPQFIAVVNTVASWVNPFAAKKYWQESEEQHNLLKHCGGMGPYVEGTGYGINRSDLPESLTVDMVVVFSRHGERYPTVDLGKQLREVYDRLRATKVDEYEGPLAFVKDWEYFVEDQDLLEMETNMSRFSGLQDMRDFGVDVRNRYGNLYDLGEGTMPFFTSGSQRVIDSAKAFAEGFFTGQEDKSRIVVLPERKRQGYNTLTTGRSCKPYHKKTNYPHPYIPKLMAEEAERLNKLSPGFHLTASDLETLAQYCAFELNAKGESDVCNALSMETFIEHEYIRDAELYYTKAEHPYTFTLGSVYMNATLTLLNEDESNHGNQSLWFSFSHDTDILYFMNALGVFDHQEKKLPIGQIDFSRFFRTSELIPMGARIVLERISEKGSDEKYLRLLINDAVIPLKNCQDGPYFTCKLSTLSYQFYEKLGHEKSFAEKCRVKKKRPQYLSFYWDWVDGDYGTDL
ncbi:DEKNAAC101234 [Brettanomyces naardenensis]|uniref:DEKNAAC101234 n=1 Tax=Brettanomyces naardenensis TaxID=13370 RepID=A0A448YHG5_BRENA|nr:DEKNAAC101234 [Brettanomyces naardenensis]